MNIARPRGSPSSDVAWPRVPVAALLLLLGLPLGLSVGWLCGTGQISRALWITLGSIVSVAALVRPEIGIYVLAVTLPFAPRVLEIGPYSLTSTELLVVWLSFCLLVRLSTRKQQAIHTPLDSAMLALAILVTFLTAAGDVVRKGTGALPDSLLETGKNWVVYVVLYFLVVHSMANRRQINRAISLLLIACTILALSSYVVYRPLAQPEAARGPELARFADLRFGAPNTYGAFALMIASLALAQLVHARKRIVTALPLLTVVALSLSLGYTYSRSAFILAGLTVGLLLYGWRRWLTPLAFAVPFLFWYAMPVAYRYRVAQASPLRGAESFRYYVIERVHLPECAFVLSRPVSEFLWGIGLYPAWDMQDNIYLFTLRSAGILSLGALIWLLIAVGMMLVRSCRAEHDPQGRALAWGSLAVYVIMVVWGMAATSFIRPLVAAPFWLIIGLAASQVRMRDGCLARSPCGRRSE